MEIPNSEQSLSKHELAHKVVFELAMMALGLCEFESKAACARAAESLSRILGINGGRGKVGNEEFMKELKNQHPEVARELKIKLRESSKFSGQVPKQKKNQAPAGHQNSMRNG